MLEMLIDKAKERHLTTIVRCLFLTTGLEGLELKSLCLYGLTDLLYQFLYQSVTFYPNLTDFICSSF